MKGHRDELVITWEVHGSTGKDINADGLSQRHALYRAVQELLTNVQKHAKASEVWVQLNVVDEQSTFAVTDNGRGFVKGLDSGAETTGFGVRGLRERMTQVGGTISIAECTGSGTAVTVSLPIVDSARDDDERGKYE